MCGRFTLALPADTLRDFLALARAPNVSPRYNIAPTQPVAAARDDDRGERTLAMLRWGLVPRWAKDPSIGARMINARAETLAEKPAFRTPFRTQRCLVPADGFYEWQKAEGRKQPFHFRRPDGGPFAIAGLWDRWQAPDGNAIESCTLITTAANDVVRPVHDRMPALLAPSEFARWLDPAYADTRALAALLAPSVSVELVAVPVSPRVNRSDADGPELVLPVSPPGLPGYQGTSGGSPADESSRQSGSSSG